MPNYKEGFEILKDKLKVALDKTNDFNFISIDLGSYYADSSLLTESEYKILKECFNAESDSLKKIIEDFKELGYEKVNEYWYYWHKEDLFLKNEDIFIEISVNGQFMKYNNTGAVFVTPKEIQLINRIYRLWGIEIC